MAQIESVYCKIGPLTRPIVETKKPIKQSEEIEARPIGLGIQTPSKV